MYDVFPSFRGEDVRYNFLSHIKKEFERKTITFFNDNGIERGESIAPELIQGIRGSKIAIVLLSKNYASSKWCLEELVEIMKCREELGQTVIAIFYKVDPSDVKKLTGDFGEVFRKTCKGKAKEEIRRWEQALEKVAVIAGYHLSNWDDEATVIEDISTYVLNKLVNSPQPSHFDNLVGMSTHMENLELLLSLGSKEVRMVGIWGPSGIGKSTIARVLFNQHSHQFQFSVFMENIKRLWPRPYYDEYSVKLQLQEEFLSRVINQKDIKIQQLGVVEDRLKDKRVLAILDDVDHLLQIEAIAKEARWFGPGSWIIITTQDKRLLYAHGINQIYEVELPPDEEALEIFCMNAFCQKSPPDGFKELAWEVTRLAGKLPLGLRVMGSHFKGRPKHEWEEGLPRLRTRLNGEIENTLKFSYDALCDDDQAIFLHLACFLKHDWLETVERCLEKNFVGVKGCLRVLAEKSFISAEWGYIQMHDLLALLGREIVRKQSIHEPGQRQFLVDAGDICQVLRDDTLGSRNVIGIDLDLSKLLETGLKISDRVFKRMPNVQFLRVKYHSKPYPHSIDPVTCLPSNLRILDWDSFPMTCLPSNFNPEFLVEIVLTKSNFLEKLWEGNKTIRNLKLMNLSNSKNLKELPDLSTATNLQTLDLSGCSSLTELPFSIGNAINLRYLDLTNCSSLVEFPSSMENVTTLEELFLKDCSSLVELPSSVRNSLNLKVFTCSGCSNLVELPLHIDNANDRKRLDLSGCSSLRELPSSIGNMTNLMELDLRGCSSLRELPSSIGNITNLEKLYLNGCSSLVELSSSIGNMTNLMKLYLYGCSSLRELPSSIGNITSLEELDLYGCSSLVELPSSIGNMTNLEELNLIGCSSLVELPSSIGNMSSLMKLYPRECSSLVEFPSTIGNMTSRKELNLNGCSSLVELPASIGNMTSLEELNLNGCSSLVKLPSSVGDMSNLRKLYLESCSNLTVLPININMKSLDELVLTDCSSLKSFPEISTNIRVLKLSGTAIEELPPSIMSWPHLRELVIKGCLKLVSLPQLPDSLEFLVADNCGSLERLDCSFNKKKFHALRFVNCFKLNQEARDLIINTSTRDLTILPGETVPTYFSYRATGSSLSMTWNGLDTEHFPTSLRFKACILVVYKGEVDAYDWGCPEICCCITDELNGVKHYSHRWVKWPPTSGEHLFVFEIEDAVSAPELVFEFEYGQENWEIKECWIHPLETLAPSC
ncbi:disease resistance protein TAO1-like [Brassica napus]|uniref:disease resistance protein TAO1-like n=1 Tax=Brassica napus TaxID=3708 RepID=UPI002078F52F|nr:disease resistance protein TAO1-like [Brassica napus]